MQEIYHMQIKQINSKIEYIVVKAKTNSLDWWLCLKITVFCHLLNQKMVQRGEFTSSSPTL